MKWWLYPVLAVQFVFFSTVGILAVQHACLITEARTQADMMVSLPLKALAELEI